MNQSLAAYISRYIEISNREIELFESYLRSKSYQKKEYILREGETCKSRYFITKGCLRLYYIDNKGNEQIMHFAIENWWITDYDSLLNEIPSRLNIQTIEATDLLELKETDLSELYVEIPKLERFFRIIMERTYIAAQRRTEHMFSMSSEEIYKGFIKANPMFIQRIPQYMLASYLGITPEYLSALRKH